MRTKSRIESILNASILDSSITGLPTFDLSKLDLGKGVNQHLEFQLPSNLRLGHLAEKIFSKIIAESSNYRVLYENIQLIEDKKTIGEIDFIIEEVSSNQATHVELAYKFYLYDPTISEEPLKNWIGPNRNDSLNEKLEKLKSKQLPLLYHPCAKDRLNNMVIEEATQAICLLVSLFIPYEYKASFTPVYEKAIKGYYVSLETLSNLDNSEKSYHVPSKVEWGMDPSGNEVWANFKGVEESIVASVEGQQAPLCWMKDGGVYSTFFIVWW
jgi:hypothetical protein